MSILKQFYNAIALLAILNLLVVSGFFVGLVGSGRLNAERLDKIAAVLRGEQLEPPQEIKETATTTAPASQPTVVITDYKSELLDQQLKSEEIQRQRRALQDLLYSVNEAQRLVLKEREELKKEQQAFMDKVKQEQQAIQKEGFSKTLKMYSDMAAKLAKEHFMQLEIDDVARYLDKMSPRASKKIINEFKTEEEQARIREILKKINNRVDNS